MSTLGVPQVHSVHLYRTVGWPAGVQGRALNVKYQSRAHPAARRGSLNVGAPESPQHVVSTLISHAAACRGRDAILPVHILSNL